MYRAQRRPDGGFAAPANIGGPVNTALSEGDTFNTDQTEFCPMVTPDGKYLFFSRRWGATREETTAGDVYWVDIRILDQP